ncbi:tigger transposable element-derived protein 1 [Trichonephila clavipes]|nr:tigger transposable element-derived protein 1 [Trichonephila clavipes]
MGGRDSALDRFNVHRCPTRWVFSGTGIEHVRRQATIQYLYHSATAAMPRYETKIKILDCLAKGERSTAVGKRFHLGESTIRAIKKNEAAIRKSVRSGTNLSSKISSYSRDTLIEKTEKALVIWIEDLTQKRIPLDGHLIKMKALKFYKELKESEPSTSSRESNPQFSASTGWLTGFIKRHSFHNLKIKGEVASADEEAARKYPEKLAKIIKDGEYCAHQVFNPHETQLFWKKMPTRTYIAKSEKTASGFKAAKDRVTLLLCSNASGDRMLKPLLVNRSLKPRALKGKDLNTLPVHWMANKKAWVTTAIFTEWFNKCFVPEVENYMNEMGLEFKILLILDNAPGHPILEHPNIKEIGGEGFDDFGEHDIEELLVDEALNDDDILESMVDITKDLETVDSEPEEDVTPLDEKLLREGLQLSGKLANFFIQNDNDVERALKFQRDLKFCMSGYRELYKELVPSQSLITDYLVKEKKKSLKFLKKHYHVDLMT